ncbi:MAG: response regulator transcription factor [Alphaproteobacteria bacterium]
MTMTKTLLVNSSKLFGEGLASLLHDTQFEIERQVTDVAEFEAAFDPAYPPELILFVASSAAVPFERDIEKLYAMVPRSRIVVLAGDLFPDRLTRCLSAGADGYLLKDISCEALLQSLRLVMVGEKVFPTDLAAVIMRGITSESSRRISPNSIQGLSERETQILRCLVRGDANKVIASRLNITEATVKVHLKSALRKINVANRTQAAIWALNNGLVASGGMPEGLAARS